MVTIKLYSFSKKKNSTKQPTGSGTDFSCLIKTGSSIIEPVVLLKDNPTGYNYAYISDFGRYYFVTDISYQIGEWALSLTVDPMASFKTEISTLTPYVVRSASTKDGYIKDSAYPLTGAHTKSVQDWSPLPISSTGYFYLTVASKSASQYALKMNQSNFDTLINDLMAYGDDVNNWQTIEQSIMNQTFNPIQYITSVYWSPISFTASAGGVGLTVGSYPTNAAYSYILDKYYTVTHSFSVSSHPQASARGRFCNMSPYSEHTISAGGFGIISVPGDLLTESSNTVTLDICIDTRNGTATLVCKCNGVRFARVSGSVGVQVPVSQVSRDILGAGVSLAGGLGQMFAGNLIGGLASVLGGVQNALGSNVSTTGTLGSLANLYDDFHLTSVWYDIAGADNTNNGSPYCKTATVSTLSGYLQCEKGIFESATATDSEISEVNAYMVSGMYYE